MVKVVTISGANLKWKNCWKGNPHLIVRTKNVQIFFKKPSHLSWNTFFFSLSWLTSLQLILCHVAGFYKPTIPQSPPSHLRDYSTCNNARFEFFLSNGHSPQIRENGELLVRMWRGESHFSQKWHLANVGESGEYSVNFRKRPFWRVLALAKNGEFRASTRIC